MGRLEGKSVIITGAGSGIGRGIAAVHQGGAKLIAVDRAEGVKERRAGAQAGGTAGRDGRRRSEKDVMAFIDRRLGLRKVGCDLGQCRDQRGLVPIAEPDRGTLAGDPAHQPDRSVPRSKYAMPHMIKQKYGSIVLHRVGGGPESGASGHPYAASRPA